jgi:hypothetical protein
LQGKPPAVQKRASRLAGTGPAGRRLQVAKCVAAVVPCMQAAERVLQRKARLALVSCGGDDSHEEEA